MINVAELLKDCPKGMELYSPLCGTCVFDRLSFGTIICKKQNTQEITFTSEGYYMLPVFDNCECMIFPSKDQRDWSKFHRPFEDGDILTYTSTHTTTFIYRNKDNEPNFSTSFYVACNNAPSHNFLIYNKYTLIALNGNCEVRLATEEEKAKLFQAIKDNGYKWNFEIMALEKLPKFKVGDKIRHKKNNTIIKTIGYIYDDGYALYDGHSLFFEEQDEWELVPNKFDIATLKPFDKVLVRDYNHECWMTGVYSHQEGNTFIASGHFKQCIPYKNNEYLLGKRNDCDDFYKIWEE